MKMCQEFSLPKEPASWTGHLPLAQEKQEASVGIPDSNRGSEHIICRTAFQNHAYVIEINLPGNNYRLTRESTQLHLP